MASSAGLNSLAHSVTFGINLAVFTNLAQYMYTNPPSSRDKRPFICVVVATVLVLLDLVRHLINDSNNWFLVDPKGAKYGFDFDNCIYNVSTIQGSLTCSDVGIGPVIVTEENALGISMSMYNEDGSLSVYGWGFTIFGTWTGFILLFIGIMWYSDILSKMRRQYTLLRRRDDVTEAFLTPESRPVELADPERPQPNA